MRVTTPMIYRNAIDNLQLLAQQIGKINMNISTTKKYQNIYENPVDIQSALNYDTNLKQIDQYQRNLDTAGNWLKGSESALQNISDLLKGAKTLAEQMATGTYNADNRADAVSSVENFMGSILEAINTKVNGQYLFSGTKTDTAPYTLGNLAIQKVKTQLAPTSTYAGTATATVPAGGQLVTASTYLVEVVTGGTVDDAMAPPTFKVSEDGGKTWATDPTFTGTSAGVNMWGSGSSSGNQVKIAFSAGDLTAGDQFIIPISEDTYQGDDNSLEVTIGENSRLPINVTGEDALGGGGSGMDVFQILTRLKTSLANNDAAGAGAVLAELNGAYNNLQSSISSLGARSDRVITKTEHYKTMSSNLTTSLSAVQDTDLTGAITALTLKQTAYQAALSASSSVMQLSLLNYM
jgi:flagellar hook-associated protein 3 FlgL